LIHLEPRKISGAIVYLAIWVWSESAATVKAASHGMKIRPPAVAGLFYAANAHSLQATVAELLAAAPTPAKAAPKALIAPHAGYVYSGGVAAAAFATLRARAHSITRVVLIGPAHYVPVRGIAAPTVDAFETPLGRVPVDRDAIAAIADLPFVVQSDTAHVPEHALEVELPFLQALVRDFLFVPLVVGDAQPQEVSEVLARLWGNDETLIVISSDLSHYHDYATAQRLDAATAHTIEQGEWDRLGPQNACGFLPIAGLLPEAARRNLQARRLALANSGDSAGERARVVGYGAWAFA
jgi:MEMO1 family protein